MANVLEEIKAVLTSQQLITTNANGPTLTIRENGMMISIKYYTTASIQKHTVTPTNNHINTLIDNPIKHQQQHQTINQHQHQIIHI